MAKLPQEILFFQILPRLPIKSLPNLMCVCKKWYLFLKSGVFATTYHHHVTDNDDHPNHHKYIVLPTHDPYRYTYTTATSKRNTFRSFDCETPRDGLTASHPLPFHVPLHFGFNRNISILSSLHGLLCVGKPNINPENPQEYSDLILWNPLTGENKTLSRKGSSCHDKVCYENFHGIFALYYISCDDDYRVVRITHHPNIYVYSLKSDSWRKVESTKDFQQRASNWASLGHNWEHPNHILLNEKLYFIKQVNRGQATFIHSYSVIRFDTKTEKFTEIGMPSFGNQMTSCLDFTVVKGCIHFWVAILTEEENYMTNYRRCYEMIELWRMNGDGDWTKVLSCGPMSFFLWSWSLVHLMRNGNWVIQNEGDVYLLDMMKHTKEMVFTRHDHPIKSPDGYSEPYRRINESKNIPPTGKYIETIVSPNQYSVNVRKWKLNINGLGWCTVSSWAEYEACEKAMIDKYGKEVTQRPHENVELWAQS